MRALTANRLADGEAVFWNNGRWVERFVDAQLFEAPDAAETAEAAAKSALTVVVDPYLIDVIPAGEGWAPLSFRERIRCLGPSNHPQHGKQAAGGADVEALAHASGAARSSGRVNLIKRK
jgi:hypothetical protein